MKNDTSNGFNPWPYSIIGFFSLAIVAAVGWVGFCIGHGSDLVAIDYYEQEVQYQDQLDRMERARELTDLAGVSYDAGEGLIKIQLPQAHAALRPEGMIHLYRPSEASLDQILPLELTAAGEQRLDARSLTPGLWDVRVRWIAQGREYFLNEKFRIERNTLH